MPDSIKHRAYFCQHPDVVVARESAAPEWIVKMAKGDDSEMWVTGIFRNPVGKELMLAREGEIMCEVEGVEAE
ncbi:MAG: hypothetical protein ACKPKO_04085, partial [Candidatus Fonsibacter sp.]